MSTSSHAPPEHVLQLEHYWPYQITVLSDRIARRTSKIVKSRGLNLSQWRVLAAIAEVPGRTSADVVHITPIDKGIVSRATKALIEMGLVRRQASQSDGRISHLFLTETGQDLYSALIPDVEAILLRANTALSQQQQARMSQHLRALMDVIPDLR